MSKHKKSQETSKNDGRKNNKRLAPKPLSSKQKLSVPSRTTKAKKDRVESYAISAMKSEFGSEKDFFVHLAGQAKESFNALKLFMEYAYGKPSDVISNSGRSNSKSAPQITFNVSSPVEPTIDITPEDEQ
jgi:hypothetical protein|tara:strand:+ start:175 stop:564 length:390 start_codon:yes stop_codon:yes gene_type:complete